MKNYWDKLKVKWNIESDKRMVLIFIIFSITGSATVVVRKNLFNLLEIDIANPVLFFFVKLITILIIYQILLFIVGTLLGEHKFVKWFLGKSLGRFKRKK